MWQKFTERARRVIFFAQEEAAKCGHNLVMPEHVLLGLVREDDNTAGKVLRRMNVAFKQIRSELEPRMARGEGRTNQDMQLAVSAKKAVDLAYEEARGLHNDYIGTEHLLLGLIREGDAIAARTLVSLGADLAATRQVVRAMLAGEECEPVIPDTMRGRDLLSISDLSADEIRLVFDTARVLKSRPLSWQVEHPILPGKTLAMIFEKPSLRTRVTFEVGMTHLGGHAVYIQPSDAQLGTREIIPDAARNLDRWVQGIMARTFAHKTVLDLAKYANIPVINGLSDMEHPCQALTDFFTFYEKKGDLTGIKLAYVGDGCNTCNSLLLLASKVGASMSTGCPEGFEPDAGILSTACKEAEKTGASILVTHDPYEAVKGANVVYTDVWASMGLEHEKEERLPIFQPFQVNRKLVEAAAEDAMVMHCMPAKRGEEITDEVLDGPQSVAFDQAENRLHVQKAILALLL